MSDEKRSTPDSKSIDGEAFRRRMREQQRDGMPPPAQPRKSATPPQGSAPRAGAFSRLPYADVPSPALSPIARDLGFTGEAIMAPGAAPPLPALLPPGDINEIAGNADMLRRQAGLIKRLAAQPSKEHLERANGRPCLCVVTGTYNRLASLRRAIASVRNTSAGVYFQIVVVDGGSTDGTRQWLRQQHDVHLIEQTDQELTGAVKAFNLGFAYAVKEGFPFVMHFNDDAEVVTPDALLEAIHIIQNNERVGEVAFAFDLRGDYSFDEVHGRVCANFGIVRRQAGMMVAMAQGDPKGSAWWNPIYRTYGADNEFACWLWKLGWQVFAAHDLHVHDWNVKDHLREVNESSVPQRRDSRLFWQRWPDPDSIK